MMVLNAPEDNEEHKKNLAILIILTWLWKTKQEQFTDLTRAFIRAGVPNIAIPQDNVLFANLYKYVQENKIRCFLKR